MQIADRYVVHEQRIAGSPQLRIVIYHGWGEIHHDGEKTHHGGGEI